MFDRNCNTKKKKRGRGRERLFRRGSRLTAHFLPPSRSPPPRWPRPLPLILPLMLLLPWFHALESTFCSTKSIGETSKTKWGRREKEVEVHIRCRSVFPHCFPSLEFQGWQRWVGFHPPYWNCMFTCEFRLGIKWIRGEREDFWMSPSYFRFVVTVAAFERAFWAT